MLRCCTHKFAFFSLDLAIMLRTILIVVLKYYRCFFQLAMGLHAPPPSINRCHLPLPKTHHLSFLSSLLYLLLYFLVLLFPHYSGSNYLLFQEYFLASSEILGISEKFLLYPGGLAQHTADKSLRAVYLHASGSTFCS